MSDKPFFSIITITKNSSLLFAYTAESLLAQSFTDFEWIVVDGSDQPDSLTVVDGFINANTILIRGLDSGISDAFNLGLARASGSNNLFLNAGDTYSSDFLSVCSTYTDGKHIVCGSPYLVGKNSCVVGRFHSRPLLLWRGMHVAHNWLCVPSYFYRSIGGFKDLDHAMDYDWCKRVVAYYGFNIFRVLPTSHSCGTFLLGGHSSRNYFKGLAYSFAININYGMSSLLALLVYLFYAINFFTKHLIRHNTHRLWRFSPRTT